MARNPRVIILSEQLRGQSFELTEEQYTIGRTEESAICIPDPTVSGHHCTLKRTEGAHYLVLDMGSTNGTRVNGVKVEGESQVLVNSDILQVGGVEMLFDSDENATSSSRTTQTVIQLDGADTGEVPVSDMPNFSPFGSRGQGRGDRESKAVTILFGGIIGLLVAAVLVSLVVLMFKLAT